MIVIADTTPLNYPVLIEEVEVLPKLYGRVIIPEAVVDELEASKAPAAVRQWMANRPASLEVRQSTKSIQDAGLRSLDASERAAMVYHFAPQGG